MPAIWRYSATVFAFCLGLVGTLPGQTIFLERQTGNWFEPKLWSEGIPQPKLAGVIPAGTATATPRGGKLVSARALTIGQAALRRGGEAALISEGLNVVVQEGLTVGEGGSVPLSAKLEVGGDLRAGGNVQVGGPLRVGWGRGSATTKAESFIQRNLIGEGNAPVLTVGLGEGSGNVTAFQQVAGTTEGFHQVIVGHSRGKAVGSIEAQLVTPQLVGTGRSTLGVGIHEAADGQVTGRLELPGNPNVAAVVQGFSSLHIGQSPGGGFARGEVDLLHGRLEAGRIEVGNLQVKGVDRGRGLLTFRHSDLVTEVLQVSEPSQLAGHGTVQGFVVNQGILAPLAGSTRGLILQGDYVQAPTGSLDFAIGGPRAGLDYGTLAVLGGAEIDGDVDIRFQSGFEPRLGQAFSLVEAQKLSGQRRISVHNLPPNLAVDFPLGGSGLEFQVTEPQSLGFANPSEEKVAWSNPSLWAGGAPPQSVHQIALENQLPFAQEIVLGGSTLVHQLTLAGSASPLALTVAPEGFLSATQTVEVADDGLLSLRGGTISSPHVSLSPRARFHGGGTIEGNLANQGRMTIGGDASPELALEGNFEQGLTGRLAFDLSDVKLQLTEPLQISGQAALAGALTVEFPEGLDLTEPFKLTLIEAEGGIEGLFSSLDVPLIPGFELGLTYGEDTVVLFSQQLTSGDLGDMNIDGVTDQCDIDAFALGIGNPSAYFNTFFVAPGGRGNVNEDGNFDFDDIAAFVELVEELPCEVEASQVPEPTNGFHTLLIAGLLAYRGWKRRRS